MSSLDYVVESEVECSNAFVHATASIGGRDTVEKFMACKIYPLASGVGFRGVTIGTTPMSKVPTPLPILPVEAVSEESASRILTEVETEAQRILGSFGSKEYDVFSMAKLPNGGHLNHIFEQMLLAYTLWQLPETEAFQAAREKRKAEVSKKPIAKKAKTFVSQETSSKAVPSRKIGVVKMVRPRVKLRLQGTSEIELALVKPVGVSKKICLLDAPSSSHDPHDRGLTATKAGKCTARVVAFDNLGDDSSPDVHGAPLPSREQRKVSAASAIADWLVFLL
jgi:hypothetical protein